MKKPIKCLTCRTTCLEIRKCPNTDIDAVKNGTMVKFLLLYPKDITEPNPSRIYHEYRYVCPKCGKEWVEDTLSRDIMDVPKDAQFHFNRKGKMVTYDYGKRFDYRKWKKAIEC